MQTDHLPSVLDPPSSAQDSIRLTCANPDCHSGGKSFPVGRAMLHHGRFRPEFANQEFPGFFVSPCLFGYCSRSCWADLCSD